MTARVLPRIGKFRHTERVIVVNKNWAECVTELMLSGQFQFEVMKNSGDAQ